jgi:hypothetical protein
LILDNICPGLNNVDDQQQADNQPENSEMKTFENYLKALE